MELAHAVADAASRLLVAAVRGQAEQLHRVEHAAVDGLEAVANVGQRASDDDGHRVVEVRLPHLLFDRGVDLAVGHCSSYDLSARPTADTRADSSPLQGCSTRLASTAAASAPASTTTRVRCRPPRGSPASRKCAD